MWATLVMALIAAGYVLWRRSCWWYATTLGSESALSCLYPWYGDNPLHYYKIITSPLSSYLFSITLRRSIPRARTIYLVMLASQAVFLQAAGWLLFGSPATGLIAGCCYLLYTLAPRAFILEMEPEAHGYFFASLGLMLTALGLHWDWNWLVYFGVFTGSLSFHCKITLQDGLATLAAIGCLRGIGPLFWTGCAVWAGSGLLFVLLLVLGDILRHENDRRAFLIPTLLGKLKVLVTTVHGDLGIRYPGRDKRAVWAFLNMHAGHHARIAWPLAAMTLAAVAQGFIAGPQLALLAILTLLPVAQCLARVNYQAVYAFMIHFPLGVGAGAFLTGNWPTIADHPVAALLALALAAYVVSLTVRESDQIKPFTARTRVIKDNILDPIRGKVGPDDYVFQDSWMVLVYPELGCRSPNMSFLWADRIQLMLRRQEDVDALIGYFTENRPKYFIAHKKHFNLDYLEAVTGLRYELRNTVYAFVYELVGTQPPSEERADALALFRNPGPRYARDGYRKRWMSQERLA